MNATTLQDGNMQDGTHWQRQHEYCFGKEGREREFGRERTVDSRFSFGLFAKQSGVDASPNTCGGGVAASDW